VKPSLLIASPQMHDPFFERSVVLVWHHDDEGAIGVIINRELDHTVDQVLSHLDADRLRPYVGRRVGWGGPVEPTTGTVVTRHDLPDDQSWSVDGGITVSRSMDALNLLLERAEPFLLCLGYAGWGPGQLDEEIRRGGWLWTDCDAGLIFDAPPDERYDRALATLGLRPHEVWMQPIDE